MILSHVTETLSCNVNKASQIWCYIFLSGHTRRCLPTSLTLKSRDWVLASVIDASERQNSGFTMVPMQHRPYHVFYHGIVTR